MTRLLLAILTVALGGSAVAAPVVLAPFTGPHAEEVRDQVSVLVCAQATCLVERPTGPAVVITGKVVEKKKKKPQLELVLKDAKGKAKVKEKLALTSTYTLPPKTGDKLLKKLRRFLPPPEAPVVVPEPAPLEPVVEKKEPAPEPEPVAITPAPRPARETRSLDRDVDTVVTTAVPAPLPERGPKLWVGGGAQVVFRQKYFAGLATPELVRPTTWALIPRVSLAFYPFADDGRSGLGAEASFASTVSDLVSRAPDATHVRQLDAVVTYGIHPVGPLWIKPLVGFRWHQYDDIGLGTEYRALRGGLGVTLAPSSRFRLFAGGSYVQVLGSAGEVNSRYFPAAKAGPGVSVEGGVEVQVTRWLELSLTGNWELYTLALNAQPGDLYFARSMADSYAGGTASARFSF